jgi:hypothetical protein
MRFGAAARVEEPVLAKDKPAGRDSSSDITKTRLIAARVTAV